MAVNVPSFLPEPFANEGQRATIPDTPSSEQGRASYQQGFPQVCAQPLASGGIPPNYLDFQGILYDLSNSICYMQTGALWPWSSTLTYPLGAHVLGSDSNEYVAVQENSGQDPTQDPTNVYWLRADAGDGVPVGTIVWSAATQAPNGYLLCNGATVGRTTYSALFAAIGTTYGAGDGSTTFALPNLIGRVMWGGTSPGQYLAAGLPNIKGSANVLIAYKNASMSGAFSEAWRNMNGQLGSSGSTMGGYSFTFNASSYNSTYSDSVDTVQPPALVLCPYIKAFSAATNQGMIDLTALANDIAALDAERLKQIGQIDYFARGTLPEGWVIADGSLILFEDYPEFAKAYESGAFNGMLLESTATSEEKDAWRGKWIKHPQGLGLYSPRLSGLFLRNGGSPGQCEYSGLPSLDGRVSFLYRDDSNTGGAFALVDGKGVVGNLVAPGKGSVNIFWADLALKSSTHNSIFGASSEVRPPCVNLSIGIYLGRTAQV